MARFTAPPIKAAARGWGTVFKVTPAGEEHVLYSFKAGTDGGYPYGDLVALDGTLYGTTYTGGAKWLGYGFQSEHERRRARAA